MTRTALREGNYGSINKKRPVRGDAEIHLHYICIRELALEDVYKAALEPQEEHPGVATTWLRHTRAKAPTRN
jgi:hypothetical protein